MNTESINTRPVERPEAPGDFCIDYDISGDPRVDFDGKSSGYIYLILPGGIHANLPIVRNTAHGIELQETMKRPYWTWDGNREKPSLHPSINSIGVEKWHGWLRAGRLESC